VLRRCAAGYQWRGRSQDLQTALVELLEELIELRPRQTDFFGHLEPVVLRVEQRAKSNLSSERENVAPYRSYSSNRCQTFGHFASMMLATMFAYWRISH
jgi:hypothetical protein